MLTCLLEVICQTRKFVLNWGDHISKYLLQDILHEFVTLIYFNMWYIAKWCACCDFGPGVYSAKFHRRRSLTLLHTIFTVKVLSHTLNWERYAFQKAFITGPYSEWIAGKRKYFSHKPIRLFEIWFNWKPF